jgi:hypothetical protein
MENSNESSVRAVREAWLQGEIAKIMAGGDMRMVCCMSTADRLEVGLCAGAIPLERLKRGSDTCSRNCQADKKRLRRWQASKGSCRLCGRGLSRKRALDPVLRAHKSIPVEGDHRIAA